ncbi:MAG: hypothetical protein ACLQRH_17380 [Acidimicrobiales bacterium]
MAVSLRSTKLVPEQTLSNFFKSSSLTTGTETSGSEGGPIPAMGELVISPSLTHHLQKTRRAP